MTGSLNGKVAVITGGCSGIGLGTVELFIAEGAKVVCADVQDEKGAMLEARFGDLLRYVHCDVTQEADIAKAINTAAEAFGGLDILFNNAGAGGASNGVEDMTAEAWDSVQNLLVRSVILGMKHAVPFMRARGGGAIVNTASIAGYEGQAGQAAYSAAKGGIIGMTLTIARDLAPIGIRAVSIAPGTFLTLAYSSVMTDEQAQAKWGPMVPNPHRMGDPDEYGILAAHIVANDFLNGTTIRLDGAQRF
jgi:NAD(P)-dependent dehydrogenase (short-subunit alcohol dehydrogenase family)